jgi:hypothetical protein
VALGSLVFIYFARCANNACSDTSRESAGTPSQPSAKKNSMAMPPIRFSREVQQSRGQKVVEHPIRPLARPFYLRTSAGRRTDIVTGAKEQVF